MTVSSNVVNVSVAGHATGHNITGTVVDAAGTPLAGVLLRTTVAGAVKYRHSGTTGGWGFYDLPNGTYAIEASMTGYVSQSVSVTVAGKDVKGVRIVLVAG